MELIVDNFADSGWADLSVRGTTMQNDDIKRYRRMKLAELRELPREALQELAQLKQRNGNASRLAMKAQGILFCMAGGEPFSRNHNPQNAHRAPSDHGMGHN